MGECLLGLTMRSSYSLSKSHFIRAVVILDMANNLLTGSMPASYANLVNLESFDVSGNDVTGAIPQGMCGLEQLTTLVADCDVTCGCCSACI